MAVPIAIGRANAAKNHPLRRNGRVVECGGLENRCAERHRGFESLFLRQSKNLMRKHEVFIFRTSVENLFSKARMKNKNST